MDYLEKILLSIDDQRECNLIIDKAIYPVVKKDPLKYIDLFKKWMKHDNEYLLNSLQKVFIKLINADSEKLIFTSCVISDNYFSRLTTIIIPV